ncbi:MAG: DegT/DnrJ/EryC1/StrS family aminotransferase [Thermoguttaceae bacterium]|nr:DegT/DnrJ/EryC1/StrS family aminotransferase [Thermoguttaceae bacterium]
MSSDFSVRQTTESVPLLDLKRLDEEIKVLIAEALLSVNDSGMFVLGPEVQALEHEIASYHSAQYGIGCASGSDALLLSLMAAKIGPGDEVIVPSFTFFATASCVTRLGATPIFADIDPVTFNLDPKDVEAKITPRTRAIIPVHLYGQMADMRALRRLTQEHYDAGRRHILLVEDAAQAIGARLDGIPVGNWGDIACLSFYPTKNLGGVGDGGMLITNSQRWDSRLRLLRVHGMEPRYYHQEIGINSRLDAYQAAVLRVKLQYLTQWNEKRRQNAELYREFFTEAGLTDIVTLPTELPDRYHVWHQFVIRVPNSLRNDLRADLRARKIGTDIFYPFGLHEQECFRFLGYAPQDLPVTHRVSREVLALPMFPGLTEDELWTVVDGIRAFFAANENRKLRPAASARKAA